jgi:hypothetical protein
MNQSQPQTLVIAVFLLYANAVFAVFDLLAYRYFFLVGLSVAGAGVAAGWGIANEKKWGYYLGIAVAFMPFALRLYYGVGLLDGNPLSLLFEVALVALLLHPQSREHTRIWFK